MPNSQPAADIAALAAALAKINGDAQWKLTALDYALDNGYNNGLVQNTVDVYTSEDHLITGLSTNERILAW